MATFSLDARGLKCPLPTLKIGGMVARKEVKPGDVLDIIADCPTFESDVREFCSKHKKILVFFTREGGTCKAQIRF